MKKLALCILFVTLSALHLNAQFCLTPTGGSPLASGTLPNSVVSADFNGDGKLDIVTANQGSTNISILLGIGTGSFTPAVNYVVGVNPFGITSADFNGDGKADLVVANWGSNNVSVLLGNGTGTFAPAVNFPAGTNPRSIACADFNADGIIDLAVANQASSNVSLLLGTGTGSFSAAVNFTVGTNPVSITSADFNADGKPDIATANYSSNNVSVLLGTGTGSFTSMVNYVVSTSPISITHADFNTDGIPDLATANYNGQNVSVLLGVGTGSFAITANFSVANVGAIGPYSVISADFNGDGNADLATANYDGNNLSLLQGIGTGSFSPTTHMSGGGFGPRFITSADFNGDGKADLATANYDSGNISIILNRPIVTAIATASVVCAGTNITLTGAGATTYTWSGGVSNGVAFVPPTGITTYSVSGTNTLGCIGKAIKTITVNTLPIVSVTSGSICAGKSFTIIPSGASTYTYSSGSAIVTPSTSSTYSVTGTSTAGCVSSAFAISSVTVNALPTVSVTNGSICIGQSFTMIPSGASTYTYSSGSAIVTPTTNSTFSVTGKSTAGCVSSNTALATVVVNALPTVSVTSGSVCVGQSYTIIPSGASTYTYSSGSPIVTPTTNSSYSVTGTSTAGCVSSNTAVSSITVIASTIPTITVNSGSICAGQSFTLSASGASTYTYSSGSAIVTPTTSSTYSVTGTSTAGCVSSAFATSSITVNALPIVTAVTGNSVICIGQTINLTASGATSYTWNTTSTNTVIAISPTITTAYTVIGIDANGCTNVATITQSVSTCTGIEQLSNKVSSLNAITLQPNPASTQFTLSNVLVGSSLSIMDVTGKVVYTKTLTELNETIETSNLANGIYVVQLQNNGAVAHKKLIISK